MKKNGFTLIEILAVIVILAIILAISFPIVTNTINNSSKRAAANTAKSLLRAGEMYISENELVGGDPWLFVSDITNATYLEYNGQTPTAGFMNINYDGKKEIAIIVDDWCATKRVSETDVTVVTKTDTSRPECQTLSGSLN